jgi:hypothetical protein
MIKERKRMSQQLIESTKDFMDSYLNEMTRRVKKVRHLKEADVGQVVNVGIFWVEPKKYSPKNDTWEFVHTTVTPIEAADVIGDVIMTKADHWQVWEDLEKHGVVSGEYEDVPRGRVLINKEKQICLLGNFAFEDYTYKKVKPELKTILQEEFKLTDDTMYMHDNHYDIEGMEPTFNEEDEEDDFEFDFDDDDDEEDWEKNSYLNETEEDWEDYDDDED